MKHCKIAEELRKTGMNCAQATLMAFNDLTAVGDETALKLTCAFGGGIGRSGEVCGAVTGMLMAAGLLLGHGNIPSPEQKDEDSAMARRLMERFREEAGGSVLCRELKPAPGDAGRLSCDSLVSLAARILEEELGL